MTGEGDCTTAFPAHAGMNRDDGDDIRSRAFPAHAGMNRIARSRASIAHAFPAHAGMNRRFAVSTVSAERVPRTRGDEPRLPGDHRRVVIAFPAHAGMNRPHADVMPQCATRSPHTRG